MLPADVRAISVDDHIIEPPHLWQTRLPAKYRDVGPRVIEIDELGDAILAGSTFERYLHAVMVREKWLTGHDGEWKEVFDDEGEIDLPVRKKRVRAALIRLQPLMP